MNVTATSLLRSIAAVVAGFVAMAAIVMLLTVLLGGLPGMAAPDGGASNLWLVVNLAYSFLAAAAGGWVVARLAPAAGMAHAVSLVALLVLMNVSGGMEPMPGQPDWYPVVILLILVCGLPLGAYVQVQRAARAA
jgi:hypothetical protein